MLIKKFTDLSKDDAAIAGGKGASLGEMTQAGIPVPPGFVVLAAAFERFLEETDLLQEVDAILHTVNQQEMHTVEHASEKIQALILGAQMPEDICSSILQNYKTLGAGLVAVRSSATAEDSASAAWAGQLDSFLNTTEADLLKNVQKCWASLFTPRAIFYRFEKELHLTKISVAVVVQKMVKAESAGVAFSVHPVTEDRNQLIIEVVRGLGEALVSGQVTPDSYVVEKEPRRILDINISQPPQVLSNEQILELSDLIIKIESHYNFPCDIEWAYESGKFYIVQSRPITTLTDYPEPPDVLSKLARFTFERNNSFNAIPVIYYEAGAEGVYIGAPIPFEEGPSAAIGLLDDVFESWLDRSRLRLIQDTPAINKILAGNEDLLVRLKPQLVDLMERQSKSEDRNLVRELEQINAWQREIYNWFGYLIDERIATDDLELLSRLPEVRLRVSEDLISLMWKGYEQVLKGIADKTGLSLVCLARAASHELIEILSPEYDLKNFSILPDRPVAHVVLDNKVNIYVGEEAVRIREFLLRQDPREGLKASAQQHGEIKGFSSYRGSVQGEVVILKEQDYPRAQVLLAGKNKFVLVAPMTRPEILPYLKKAIAIITDEGGITCHAAIVSRELKIPCIVGAKVASKVLKTGDMVEVDANTGVVKILERA